MRKMTKTNVDIHNGFGEWGGYMDAKKSKLEEQFAEDALKNPYKESNLFTGISIFVNGMTNPTAEELKRIMMTHGGVYHTYQKSSTTFIIANNLPDVKIRQITTSKIISPQWIVDCLKANKILEYSNYLLYTNCKVSQPKIAFREKNIEGVPVQCTEEKLFIKECKDNEEPSKSTILFNLDILNTAIRREKQTENKTMNDEMSVVKIKGNETNIKRGHGHGKTAIDPNFLSEFYNNSRLHHIATLGASFKQYISQLRELHNGEFPGLNQLKKEIEMNHSGRTNDFEYGKATIMHIDMDCFFVSVGLRSRPYLKGCPIAVTHSKGHNRNNLKNVNDVNRRKEMELCIKRHEDEYKVEQSENENRLKVMPLIDNTKSLSEIASCSYEARKFGVRNGMFFGAALKLCPKLQTIPYDFEAYKEVSNTLYETITNYTIDVEAVSCDEMYVNLTDILKTLRCSVDEFVSHIRSEIIEKTQCPCSAGIGENKLQARMATKKAKPNGQFHLIGANVEQFFSEILISDLPGVGNSITQKCNNLGIKTCAELKQIPLTKLQQEFGKKLGETLYENCRGLDNRPLTYDQIRKSVSAEVNYGIRFKTKEELDNFLHRLCAEVQQRLNEISAKGRKITLKYMVRAKEAPIETAKFLGHGFCDNVTRSVTLKSYTCDINVITRTIFNIKNQLNVQPEELRGIGIQISQLNTARSDISKTNHLKSMFAKVQTKQNLQTYTIMQPLSDESEASTNINQTRNKSFIKKFKSCSDFPTRDMVHKATEKDLDKNMDRIYDELDLSVLAELPSEIQEEILLENDKMSVGESGSKRSKSIKKSLARKLENDFQNIHEESELKVYQRAPSECISKDNFLNSNEWRNILTNWLKNSFKPANDDIEAILGFFNEFARAHRFYEVAIAFRFLHRIMAKMDCQWHLQYHMIVDNVRKEISSIYGSNVSLHTKSFFDCKNCINKS